MSQNFQLNLERAIHDAIKKQISEATDKAIAKAQEEINKEVRASVDSLALTILKNYSISDVGTHLVIKIEKKI